MSEAESLLPSWLLQRATLRGKEYAWHLDDVEAVISEARRANLVSVGGQLQFRLPAATCECYWVEVDTFIDAPKHLSWDDRVQRTAESALAQFRRLRASCDFIAEGRKAFGEHFAKYEAEGKALDQAMCFVWYVAAKDESD